MTRLFFAGLLMLVLFVALGGVSVAQGPRPDAAEAVTATIGTTFTYQGRLTDGGVPANGQYDLRFRLYDSASAGSQVNGTVTLEDVPITDGLFTVPLDFGNVFDGTALWLEIGVRIFSSTDSYTTLSPRQALSATPYALYSRSAWNLSGNSGTSAGSNFIGTKDNQSLIFKTNNTEAMRIDTSGRVSVGINSTSARFEASGDIGVMGTSSSRGVIGRLGSSTSCPGAYAVGGCAGASGAYGVYGDSDTGIGVFGEATTGRAVVGYSGSGIGVLGDSTTRGIVGTLGRTSCAGAYAVGGCAGSVVAAGVYGFSSNTVGVLAATNSGNILVGEAPPGSRKMRVDATGKGFFNGGTQTGGADYAESIRTTDDPATLEPGDVLALDPQQGYAVRKSHEPVSHLIAGVYSTQPSVLAVGKRTIDDSLAGDVPVALLGVVPTKVTAENGPIQIGDLLVTSSLPGHAMKAQPDMVNGVAIYPTGAILGKALEPLAQGTGIIQVLVTLR